MKKVLLNCLFSTHPSFRFIKPFKITCVSNVNITRLSSSMNELSLKVYGDRFRCKELSSLHDEYFVVSMLDVFISQGKVQHAEPVLNMYRRKGHQFTIQVYNQLINGWAEQGNPAKVTLLYETMIDDGITPNSHTYAILLCLYYKLNITDKLNDLIGSIRDKGYTLEHLPYQVSMSPPQMNSFLQLLDDLNIQPVKPNRRDASSYPTLVQSAYSTNDNQFNNPSDDVSQDLNDKIISKINDQFEIERKGYLEIKSILKAPTNNDADNDVSNTLKELYAQWEADLTAAIREELAQYEACLKTMEENWFSIYHLPKHLPFLATLKPEEWAQILVEEAVVMSLIRQPLGQPVFYLCQSILQPAWRKYVIHQKEKRGMDGQIERIYRKYIHFVLTRSRQWSREYWNDLQEEEQYGMTEHHIPLWPFTVGIYIGTALIDILLRTLKLPDKLISDEDDGSQWAFEHAYEFENEKRVGYIRPHPSLYSMVKRLHTKAIPMHFKMESFELPMLVPPKPWTRVNEGGYLLTPCSIVRGHSDTYQHQLLLEATQEMTPILDSLNYLGAYPWRVNTRILDIVIELFNNGGDESLDVPSTLSLPDIPVIPKDCDDQTRRSISKQRKFAKKIHKENFSLRMDMLYKLSMSNHYRDDLFWLPHNMDFRSRVYPIPPHITHLSSDVGRSLIQFGIGYPLGKRGLEWLKIHIATLHGATSKASLKERLKFTNEMLPEIFDSSDKPLDGNGWWKTSDEPWQTLACCMELTEALRSGDPESFLSHMPVHQDGSCNGLQHYAAMGRDTYGAQQVNLTPLDVPANLYAEVAYLVDKRRERDAANGHKLAQLLEGHVHRKVVKQTVMTVVYGVTWVGGRKQIEKQLKDNISNDVLFEASGYLVGAVFDSLREMFTNARLIQDWLTTSARMIALAGHPVQWITPLGMPVVQPYHRPISKQGAVTSSLTYIQYF